jgi:MraZ protein
LVFRGTFEHALDAKHRLTVPAKFRTALAGSVVLAAQMETSPEAPRALGIWKPDAFDAYTASSLAALNPISPEARELERYFNNLSHDTELDSAYRVMIPPHLMSFAGLQKDVVVTGSGRCLEVWDRASYDRYREDVLRRGPEIAASFGHTA